MKNKWQPGDKKLRRARKVGEEEKDTKVRAGDNHLPPSLSLSPVPVASSSPSQVHLAQSPPLIGLQVPHYRPIVTHSRGTSDTRPSNYFSRPRLGGVWGNSRQPAVRTYQEPWHSGKVGMRCWSRRGLKWRWRCGWELWLALYCFFLCVQFPSVSLFISFSFSFLFFCSLFFYDQFSSTSLSPIFPYFLYFFLFLLVLNFFYSTFLFLFFPLCSVFFCFSFSVFLSYFLSFLLSFSSSMLSFLLHPFPIFRSDFLSFLF